MNRMVGGLVGSLMALTVAIGMSVSPSMAIDAQRPGVHHTAKPDAAQGPFTHPDALNVSGVRLGMTRQDIGALHLQGGQFPHDLKYNRNGRVSFVAGYEVSQGDQVLGSGFSPISTLHTWGTPGVKGTVDQYVVAAYRAGSDIIILRYEPAQMDSRRGEVGQVSVTSDVAWVPRDWGHDLLEQAGW